MAIFVFFGWMIQLGEKLGLIETESQTPEHQAYRRAVMGVQALKTELYRARVVRYRTDHIECADGTLVEVRDGALVRITPEGATVLCELGHGGKLRCKRHGDVLEVKVRGAMGDARHTVNLKVPIDTKLPIG